MCMSQPDIPTPKTPPAPKLAKEATATTVAARAAQTERASKRVGQQASLITGGQGLTDLATTSRKTLLGA